MAAISEILQRQNEASTSQSKSGFVTTNLRPLHRSKNNYSKFIVIGQIIGFGKINSFRSIKSIL